MNICFKFLFSLNFCHFPEIKFSVISTVPGLAQVCWEKKKGKFQPHSVNVISFIEYAVSLRKSQIKLREDARAITVSCSFSWKCRKRIFPGHSLFPWWVGVPLHPPHRFTNSLNTQISEGLTRALFDTQVLNSLNKAKFFLDVVVWPGRQPSTMKPFRTTAATISRKIT